MDLIDKIAWIFVKDRKILCTRNQGKDVWYFPGGKREVGESDTDPKQLTPVDKIILANLKEKDLID